MLSKILSNFFWLFFLLVVAVAIIHTRTQLLQKPLSFSLAKDIDICMGGPGIALIANRLDAQPATSPRTLLKYTLPDGGDMGRLQIPNRVSQLGMVKEILSITAVNRRQQNGFILYSLVNYGSLALFFLCLALLFRNFGKQAWFRQVNTRLLGNAGLALLVPPLAAVLFYCSFLKDIQLIKPQGTHEADGIAFSYRFSMDMEWTLLILGSALLVLAHVFNNAVDLKKQNDSIV